MLLDKMYGFPKKFAHSCQIPFLPTYTKLHAKTEYPSFLSNVDLRI